MEVPLQPKAHKTLSFLHEKSVRSPFLCHQSSLCNPPLSLAFFFFFFFLYWCLLQQANPPFPVHHISKHGLATTLIAADVSCRVYEAVLFAERGPPTCLGCYQLLVMRRPPSNVIQKTKGPPSSSKRGLQ